MSQFSKKPPHFPVLTWAPTVGAFDFTFAWSGHLPNLLTGLTAFCIDTNGAATALLFKGKRT